MYFIAIHVYKLFFYILTVFLYIGGFMAKEKVVLAYSGGLDTTAIIPWLKEHLYIPMY